MEKLLLFDEIDPILKPYYGRITTALSDSFEDATSVKDHWAEKRGLFVFLKPRSIGSNMNDILKSRLTALFYGDPNVKIIDNGFFGILIENKVFIRFNKMDRKFRTSIQKRKKFWSFYNQAELEGLPPSAALIWCGFLPDRGWIKLLGYFLVCYKGGLSWYYDMRTSSIQQMSIEEEIKLIKRRLSLKDKKKKDGESDKLGNTGTDNN